MTRFSLQGPAGFSTTCLVIFTVKDEAKAPEKEKAHAAAAQPRAAGVGKGTHRGTRDPPLPSLPSSVLLPCCSGRYRQMGFPQRQGEHLALPLGELQVSLSSPAGRVGRSLPLREPQTVPGSPLPPELTAPEPCHGALPRASSLSGTPGADVLPSTQLFLCRTLFAPLRVSPSPIPGPRVRGGALAICALRWIPASARRVGLGCSDPPPLHRAPGAHGTAVTCGHQLMGRMTQPAAVGPLK